MMLTGKKVLLFAAAGAVGSAVAKEFARQGADLWLSARRREALEPLANEFRNAGVSVKTEAVDALDERQVDRWISAATSAGSIDVVLNAIGIRPSVNGYGQPAVDLSAEHFQAPLSHVLSQFLTARSAARSMVDAGRGVIMTLSASIGKEARPFMAGLSAGCAAVEGMTRSLAAEFGPRGVRVVCLSPGAMLETRTIRETIAGNAETAEIPEEAFRRSIAEGALLRRTTTLEEMARVAAFLASDSAGCLTGQVISMSCGQVVL